MKTIDWNQMSELGLLERINTEILHPLGLAAFRDPNTGNSGGAIVSDDGVWAYSDELDSKIISNTEVVERISKM